MAYVGDKAAARLVVSDEGYLTGGVLWHGDPYPLPFLLTVLERFPSALLVAAIAAGRAALFGWDPPAARVDRYTRALDAATDHALCGCEASREAWQAACPCDQLWLPVCSTDATADNQRFAIQDAVRETDEDTIRAAVCATLRRWALTGVVGA